MAYTSYNGLAINICLLYLLHHLVLVLDIYVLRIIRTIASKKKKVQKKFQPWLLRSPPKMTHFSNSFLSPQFLFNTVTVDERCSPVALLQQVAFLLAAKLLVSLQLVHAVAALLALRVLPHKNNRFNTQSRGEDGVGGMYGGVYYMQYSTNTLIKVRGGDFSLQMMLPGINT